MSNHNQFPVNGDPLVGDLDRFVHPDETRTDEQIAHDETYAVEPYGDDAADAYWSDYDELHSDKEESKAEEKYDFIQKDVEDRKSAKTWLKDAAAGYEKKRDEKYNGKVSHYYSDTDEKALHRVLENGFYATSDDNVYRALQTIETGDLRRAGWFASWPDGSYKCSMDLVDTELDLDGLREFTGKFSQLQRQREETIAVVGADPLPSQMQDVFGIGSR